MTLLEIVDRIQAVLEAYDWAELRPMLDRLQLDLEIAIRHERERDAINGTVGA